MLCFFVTFIFHVLIRRIPDEMGLRTYGINIISRDVAKPVYLYISGSVALKHYVVSRSPDNSLTAHPANLRRFSPGRIVKTLPTVVQLYR